MIICQIKCKWSGPQIVFASSNTHHELYSLCRKYLLMAQSIHLPDPPLETLIACQDTWQLPSQEQVKLVVMSIVALLLVLCGKTWIRLIVV